MLKPGERYLDIGSGWGALLMWAAEHYGVDATGITLSKNQHAHVQRLIEEKGLQGRVRVELRDYRQLDAGQPFDKISSVGMFEHVGSANMATYFRKLHALLAPGGLVMNHGITSGQLDYQQLGAGMGDFIEKYIFPGGELLHVTHVLRETAAAGLEMVDTENLRPHYARTLWAWSDTLEARLDEARACCRDAAAARRERRAHPARLPALPGRLGDELRAGLDLAAPDAVDQARRPGRCAARCAARNRSTLSFATTSTMSRGTMLYRFQSRGRPPFVMLETQARQLFEIIGRRRQRKGVITVEQMPAAISALEAAMARERPKRP